MVRVITVLLCLAANVAIAQNASTSSLGARAMGMGYASVALKDEWSVFNNIAGIAYQQNTSTAFTLESFPAASFLNRMAAVLVVPTKLVNMGLGVFRFGDDVYNEHIVTLGAANKLGIASLGARVNYIQYRAIGFGTAQAISFSIGGIADITPTLQVGATMDNVIQPEISKETNERIPTRVSSNLTWKPDDKLMAALEAVKDLDHDMTIRAGAEYAVSPKFCMRLGYQINPSSAFAGVGFRSKHFKLDYAMQLFSPLGFIHQASVTYPFIKKK